MRKLVIIGIGAGNPEHMTIQAINALNSVDVVLIPRKGAVKDDLAELRREICARYLASERTSIVEFDLPLRDTAEPSYRKGVDDWHAMIAATYRDLLLENTGEEDAAALLVWGDPSLYDSTLRIVDRLKRTAGFAIDHKVVPGITSVQALAASHRIVLNTIGNPVYITTGRQLKNGILKNVDTAVVMLDGACTFRDLPGDEFDIYWGAYLGMEDELIISGTLSDVADRITQVREELRSRTGWIMDTYVLRRK